MNGNGDVHLQQHHQHQHRVQQQPRNTTSKNNINNKNFNSSKMLSKKPVMKGHPPDKSKISPINNKIKGQQQQNQAKPLMNLPPVTLPQPQPQPLMEAKKPTFEPITIPNEVEENSIPSKGNLP